MQNDREPNWTQWRQIPYAQIWEAVALSLNIEPMKVRESPVTWPTNDDEWPEPLENLFDECNEFEERIFVAGRNLGVAKGLSLGTRSNLNSAYWSVNLAEFAAWALSLGWETPEQFAKMASANQVETSASETTKVAAAEADRSMHGKVLGERERATLLTIIAVLAQAAKLDLSQPSKAAVYIESLTIAIGARVAARTIEDHLKRIPDALERKTL